MRREERRGEERSGKKRKVDVRKSCTGGARH
jgi:hypothetical protein